MCCHRVDEPLQVEPTGGIAGSEVSATELPDQLTTPEMERRDPSLARVVQATGQVRTVVRAEIACDDKAPKLIADTLITDAGRIAPRRPRARPSTLETGMRNRSSYSGSSGAGDGSGKAECLTMK